MSDAVLLQLSRLLQELQEAQKAQSPAEELLCSLQRKLVSLERRQQSREQELQQVGPAHRKPPVPPPAPQDTPPPPWQVIGGSWQRCESEERAQAERWRSVAQDKSRQLESFRQELDSILELLRCLQREGVAPPTPT